MEEVKQDLIEPLEIGRKAVGAADEKQAKDIVLLDAQSHYSFADFFVICSGDSERQLKAIDEEIEKSLKENGVSIYHREGTPDSGWMLLDYGSVIVHIFSVSEREYYQPDELWSDMRTVLRIQ